MKTEAPPAPAPGESHGGITIRSRLGAGHRYYRAVDEILRIALRGLPGPWDVSVYPVGRTWFRVDIVAPNAASWSLSVPVHEGPGAEELADTVRAACVRHCARRPDGGKRAGRPANGSAGNRDAGPEDGPARRGLTSEPQKAAPEGTSR